MDHRRWLAPGQMDRPPESERRGLPDARVARPGLAQQSGRADPCERSCVLRESQGARTVRHYPGHERPDRRRNPERRRRRADRAPARDSAGPGPEGGRRPTRDARCSPSPTRKSIGKGITTFQDAGSSFATIDRVKRTIDDGTDARPALDDGARRQRGAPAGHRPCARHRLRQRPLDGARDQGHGGRSPGNPRRVAARALRRQARQQRPDARGGRHAAGDGANRHRPQHATVRPRDRRPRQSGSTEHLRGRLQEEQQERQGSPLADRARSASRRGGHSAFRPAWRDCVDAGGALRPRTAGGWPIGWATRARKKARTCGRNS